MTVVLTRNQDTRKEFHLFVIRLISNQALIAPYELVDTRFDVIGDV